MATPEISAAVALIPSKKAELRKAFDALQSFSSCLASFNLKWQDLEDHFAALERSIEDRLRHLEEKSQSSAAASAAAASAPLAASTPFAAVEPEPGSGAGVKADANADFKADADAGAGTDTVPDASAVEAEATAVGYKPWPQIRPPRPELRSFCVNMDGLGLRSFLFANRRKIPVVLPELGSAIRLAPDPGKLILDVICNFRQPKTERQSNEFYVTRRACVSMLDELLLLDPEISPLVKDEAKKVADKWKRKMKIADGVGDTASDGWLLLQFLLGYKLVPEFELDEVIELFVLVSRKKQAPDLCKRLGLVEHMPDLIQKLKERGRHLDAVDLIDALGLSKKYPLVPLLKSYLQYSKQGARVIRKKGNNSAESQYDAEVKELNALRAIVKAVEDYKLESQYKDLEIVKKRHKVLENQKTHKRRPASSPVTNSEPQMQRQQQSNKRPRPSTSTAVAFATCPIPLLSQEHPQLELAVQPRNMGLIDYYGPLTRGPYDAPVPAIAGPNLGASGSRSPRSHLYSFESIPGPGLYDRPAPYGNYPFSGVSDRYGYYPRV